MIGNKTTTSGLKFWTVSGSAEGDRYQRTPKAKQKEMLNAYSGQNQYITEQGGGRMSTPQQRVAKRFADDNLVAAEIVLRDVRKYGGEQSGLVRWARLIFAKQERRAA